MRKGKMIFTCFLSILFVFLLASCDAVKTQEEETGTVYFESADLALEAMTDAVLEGNYNDAIRYYNSGAADAQDDNVVNWYYYSMALGQEDDGCIGYPLDLLQNRTGDYFELADEKIGELQLEARPFNGAYSNESFYLYIADGKIAVAYEHLTGGVFCNGELVKQKDTYYWAEHSNDGADKLLYTITLTDSGLNLTAVEGAEDDLYAGTYTYVDAEMPELYY